MAAKPEAVFNGLGIEEGWRAKQRQRSSRLFGGRNCLIPCRTTCFSLVGLEEQDEFNRFF